MHVLFLPTVVLSLASAGLTFALINFVIPGMIRNLNEFLEADIGTLIERRLNRPRGITIGGKYRLYIHADESLTDVSDPNHIALRRVAFAEADEEDWVRFGTARQVSLRLERKRNGARVSGLLLGVSYYDRRLGQFVELDEKLIPANEVPTLVPQKIKFLNLGELLAHWSEPTQWREVREELARLRTRVGQRMIYDALWDDWYEGQELTLADDTHRCVVRSRLGARLPADSGIELTDVSIEDSRRGHVRTYTAERAILEVTGDRTLEKCGVEIALYNARGVDGNQVFSRARDKLGPITVPAELVRRVARLTPAELMQPLGDSSADTSLAERRGKVEETVAETVREIAATISERFAFSVSVFVLVILGAVLGIVFRGAHLITAFGISFVPSLLVIVTIIMGKQMSQNATTHLPGLLVMWSGIVVVAGLDGWTMTRVLRR